MQKKKDLKKIQKRSDRASTILLGLLILLGIIVYDVIWTHFHQTGMWNFFSIIAILLIALIPILANYQQSYNRREQEYMDKILELMLKDGLRTSKPDDEVRRIANILTKTVLESLGAFSGKNRGRILIFLKDCGLIERSAPVISLNDAPLFNAKCSTANLEGTDLRGAFLANAKLDGAILNGADLSNAQLSGADLTWTRLEGADLQEADLRDAKLSQAMLTNANLTGAQLDSPKIPTMFLRGTIMPDGAEKQ